MCLESAWRRSGPMPAKRPLLIHRSRTTTSCTAAVSLDWRVSPISISFHRPVPSSSPHRSKSSAAQAVHCASSPSRLEFMGQVCLTCSESENLEPPFAKYRLLSWRTRSGLTTVRFWVHACHLEMGRVLPTIFVLQGLLNYFHNSVFAKVPAKDGGSDARGIRDSQPSAR